MFWRNLSKINRLLSKYGNHALLIVIIVLSGLLYLVKSERNDLLRKVGELRAILSTRPTVELVEVVRTETKVVEGPTKTVYRTIKEPGERIVEEKIVYVESKETTTGTDSSKERVEAPACEPPRKSKRFYAGAMFTPSERRVETLRLGITLRDTVDVGYGFSPAAGLHHVGASIRF